MRTYIKLCMVCRQVGSERTVKTKLNLNVSGFFYRILQVEYKFNLHGLPFHYYYYSSYWGIPIDSLKKKIYIFCFCRFSTGSSLSLYLFKMFHSEMIRQSCPKLSIRHVKPDVKAILHCKRLGNKLTNLLL